MQTLALNPILKTTASCGTYGQNQHSKPRRVKGAVHN